MTQARICVTGGIACGKTLVGELLAEWGLPLKDADDVGHELMRPDRPLFARLVAAFGREIVGADGAIDRSRLGRQVFADPARREQLNRLVHPEVRRVLEDWMATAPAGGPARPAAVAAIIPLVYEAGWDDGWDRVICVSSPVCLQVQRLLARGLTETEARARIAAQWPVEKKMKRADYVIFNSGNCACVRRQAELVFQRIRQELELEPAKGGTAPYGR